MPPRILVFLIVAGWLAAMGWLTYREWWVWARPGSPPRVPFDLADEAVSQGANWRVLRNNEEIGRASSKLVYKPDNTFELQTNLARIKLAVFGTMEIEVRSLSTSQQFTASGEPLGFGSRLELRFASHGDRAMPEYTIKSYLHGQIRDHILYAHCSAELGDIKDEADLAPIALQPGIVFDPTQPLPKMHVRPGQHWTTTLLNPVEEAAYASLRQLAPRISKQSFGIDLISPLLPRKREPKQLRAQVRDKPEDYPGGGLCNVIDFHADDITGTVWVRVSDGMVLRQDAMKGGEKVSLVREN